MAHAVVNHFEAVKIQKQNREQSLFTSPGLLNKPPEPVDKEQAVGKAGKWIGHLAFGDVRLRPCHPQGSSRLVEYRQPSVQHPPKRAVFVEHPMLALKVRRGTAAMSSYFFLDPLSIRVMNSVEPFFRPSPISSSFQPSMAFQRGE